ncbi:MAG: hypothetical protein GY870_12595 [archaeon]|nr:hypothetical protein [archaeon]
MMENLNNECCLTCFTCRIDDMLKDINKRPCEHYPENMSHKGEFLQVYKCENYKPVKYKSKKAKEVRTTDKRMPIGFMRIPSLDAIISDFNRNSVKSFKNEAQKSFQVGFILGFIIALLLVTSITMLLGVFIL